MRTFLIVVGITLAVWAVAIVVLYVVGRRMTAAKLARAIPDVLALFRGLLADPRTRSHRRSSSGSRSSTS